MEADVDLEAVGRELRRHRRARGLSQEALAELAGVHPNYVGLVERGQRNPSAVALIRMARAAGVAPSELFAAVPLTSQRTTGTT